MYSAFYFYFEIRYDASYSRSVDAPALTRFLAGLDELVPKNGDTYAAREGAPWLSMALLSADSRGNYASWGTCPAFVNLISVVGSKEGADARQFYLSLMVKIAAFLGWHVMDEEDEDGNEDVVLWRP